jgi:protein-L-isoaspartate(D-aspartate) O-methyltransferase
MNEEADFGIERERMVNEQLIARDIRDPRVLAAMRSVPRHLFIPPEERSFAYADGPLPIGTGQTISQPYIVALMTQLLLLQGEEKVLEVGTGSGYQAAVLAHLARQVYSIERHPRLANRARTILLSLGVDNVQVVVGDGTQGLAEFAPFEAIIVTAAAPEAPQPLLDQLAEAGRLVIPVGGRSNQVMERWIRRGSMFERQKHSPVAFVPLVGKYGWKE